MKKNKLEQQLQNKLIGLFKTRNIVYYKTTAGVFKLPSGTTIKMKGGFSDIFVFYKGQTYFLELKSDNGVLRKTQIDNFTELLKNGFYEIYLPRPDKYDLFKKELVNGFDIAIRVFDKFKI